MGKIVGIDLGTTFSCVGVWQNDRVIIIPNEQGNRSTPSYVAFTEMERLVGESAKNQCTSNIQNTLYDVKRLIGRNFSDSTVQEEIKNFPFKVLQGPNDKIVIEVNYMNEVKRFAPEEISAMVLGKMKTIAEEYLSEKVTDAIVTVPAYFNDAQRNATRDAGIIAGLNIIRIINEPTASALAFGLSNKEDKETNILVFDFGGGTHDISVLSIEEGIFEVKGTSGNTHLGGEDIDNALAQHFIQEIKRKHKQDISRNNRAMRRLKNACETAKKTLSSAMQTSIELDGLFDGIDFTATLTRSKFEEICMPIFRKALEPVDDALRVAKLDKSKINEVVLVGGSSRIPKVQEMLSSYFNGKQLNKSVNPDEAVAYGATVQASILSGTKSAVTEDIVLLDVTPLTLGVETSGKIMTPIIPRGTTIPVKKTNTFTTYVDNQPGCTIKIYEGERQLTRDCNKLGEFELRGFPLAPRGTPQIEITYDVDVNGILNVSALEKSSGKKNTIIIKNNTNRLSKEEIDRMISDAEKFRENDDKIKKQHETKNKLEQYIYGVKKGLDDDTYKSALSGDEISTLSDTVGDVTKWLDEHPDSTAEEYEAKFNEVDDIIGPIIIKIYQNKEKHETKIEDVD